MNHIITLNNELLKLKTKPQCTDVLTFICIESININTKVLKKGKIKILTGQSWLFLLLHSKIVKREWQHIQSEQTKSENIIKISFFFPLFCFSSRQATSEWEVWKRVERKPDTISTQLNSNGGGLKEEDKEKTMTKAI